MPNTPRSRSALLVLLTAVVFLAASCGGDSVPPTDGQQSSSPTTTQAPAAEEPSTTVAGPAAEVTTCDPSIDQIDFDSDNELTFSTAPDPMYLCIEVPASTTMFRIELTGLTENLDLYVGYPDLATLQDGGFGLKFSSTADLADEWVEVEISPDLIWGPGAYYIEVSKGGASADASFVLSAHPS